MLTNIYKIMMTRGILCTAGACIQDSRLSLIKEAGDQMNRDKRKYFFTAAGGRICRHKDTCTQQVNI